MTGGAFDFDIPDRRWYVLCCKGKLHPLGNCDDWFLANDFVEDIGLDAVWIADEYTIKQWLGVITRDLDLRVYHNNKETVV